MNRSLSQRIWIMVENLKSQRSFKMQEIRAKEHPFVCMSLKAL